MKVIYDPISFVKLVQKMLETTSLLWTFPRKYL